MYQPSNSPIFPDRAAILARKGAVSDARLDAARQASVQGRITLFNTLMSPSQLAETFDAGVGIDAARLQDQTESARISGILIPSAEVDYPASDTMAGAPEVVPLSYSASFACGVTPGAEGPQRHSSGDQDYTPRASMSRRAPLIVDGARGPVHFAGRSASYPGAYSEGHQSPVTVGNWIADHGWLVLGLAGVGVLALSRRSKR